MTETNTNTDLVALTVNDHVATITLNRADKANALSHALIDAMGAALDIITPRCTP